jgi:hypothetical protein
MEQNQHLELGLINCLRIDRDTPHGLFLVAQDEKDVLLPKAYVTDAMKIDDLIEVFLYTDSEDRLIATTQKPKAMLDEFGFFDVVDTTSFGAFVDWGLMKDLLVPMQHQKDKFQVGDKRFLRVVYDEKTHRLIGTQRITKFLEKAPKSLKIHTEVKALLMRETPLGFACIVNNLYEGMLFSNEIFEDAQIGDIKTAYVKNVRNDGYIDLVLKKVGSKNSNATNSSIVELLQQNNGILPYNYKSDPELIKSVFSMSKKEFKKALTILAEKNLIEIKDTGIYLKD